MLENESRSPAEILNEILTNLQSKEDGQILKTLTELKDINYSSEAIRRQLEIISISSTNPQVRDEAREVLNLPSNRAVQKSASKMDRGVRFTILNEIKKWVNDGLLAKENADVIQSRYDFDFSQSPQTEPEKVSAPAHPEKPAEPNAPSPTLLQSLTSEASIKVYLYLGAFFVIAAAAILGAVVEELRLPILFVSTLLFSGLAVAIKKRLPQPSFALFIVASFLFPLTAGSVEQTLQNMFDYDPTLTSIYWGVVGVILAGIWSFGTRFYNSRLFSLTAFGAMLFTAIQFATAFDSEPELYTLFESLALFTGLLGVIVLKKWKDEKFALPLFISAQLAQLILLAISTVIFFVSILDNTELKLWNIASLFVWALAGLFFFISNKQYPNKIFIWLMAGTFIPASFFINSAFGFEDVIQSVIFLVWGIALVIGSEVLRRKENTLAYSLPFALASLPTLLISFISAYYFANWFGIIITLVIAILFTALHIIHSRWWAWILALLGFALAYFRVFNFEFIQNLEIPASLIWVGISFLFLLPDVFLKKDLSASPHWRLPIRFFGIFYSAIAMILLLTETDALYATIGFAIFTLLSLSLSLLYKSPTFFYAFTITLPLFVIFGLRFIGFTKWIHPVIVISVIYYAIGVLLRFLDRAKGWDSTLLYSGLGLGIIVSIASPILGGVDAVIPVAVAATLWAIEAFLKKNAWLALPANGLYVLAYFILLSELGVEEVQFFTVGAAVLGLLQHYLLTRAGSKSGAFIMGMLSQFVLLGTTYLEMINKDSLLFFFLLFAQSIVVLIYGIVTRSRSLTLFPIGFVVLGVITVAFSALKDLGTILVIGCAGILLLMLGIGAVLLRERIAKLGERLSDWEA